MDKEERKKYIFAQLRSLPNATQYVEVTKYFENLEQQCKKQKEILDKAINCIVKEIKSLPTNGCKIRLIEILDILKEVSK